MDELMILLNGIEDSYFDFVSGIGHYAEKKPSRIEVLTKYLKENLGVKSSDVVRFVSEQDDFIEEAAFMML